MELARRMLHAKILSKLARFLLHGFQCGMICAVCRFALRIANCNVDITQLGIVQPSPLRAYAACERQVSMGEG
jgi:hypothetical protein